MRRIFLFIDGTPDICLPHFHQGVETEHKSGNVSLDTILDLCLLMRPVTYCMAFQIQLGILSLDRISDICSARAGVVILALCSIPDVSNQANGLDITLKHMSGITSLDRIPDLCSVRAETVSSVFCRIPIFE